MAKGLSLYEKWKKDSEYENPVGFSEQKMNKTSDEKILGMIDKLDELEDKINKEQEVFIKDFFIQKVSPELVTIMLNDLVEFPLIKDTSGYLAVKLVMKKTKLVSFLNY